MSPLKAKEDEPFLPFPSVALVLLTSSCCFPFSKFLVKVVFNPFLWVANILVSHPSTSVFPTVSDVTISNTVFWLSGGRKRENRTG